VKMVAPSFDHNPRRVKQFVNLFRLRALLASQTGLFGDPRDPKRFNALTLEQLGKLVAIMLRWPLFLVDLEANPDLLTNIQKRVWEEIRPDSENAGDSTARYWAAKRSLIELIAFVKDDGQPGFDPKKKYGLDRVDTQRFLQVSPPVRGREIVEDERKGAAETAEVSAGFKEQTFKGVRAQKVDVSREDFADEPVQWGATSGKQEPRKRNRPPGKADVKR
jgi:hypothetical protein